MNTIISCKFNVLTPKEMEEILIEDLNLEFQQNQLDILDGCDE